MNKQEKNLLKMFAEAISIFFVKEKENILSGVSERTLCGRLAFYIENLFEKYRIEGYYAEIECNRKQGWEIKTIIDNEFRVVNVSCDLIIHSRGNNIKQDNLIAVEMKKSNRPEEEKKSDRNRLIALTKDSYDGVWSNDGKTHPKHVCGYKLGFYMEIDRDKKNCLFELYRKGKKESERLISF
ncbi:MAG: hypothetical protein WC304_03245 [Candidatus Gracilibacteria bacterium]|jgi:hypothetical protein